MGSARSKYRCSSDWQKYCDRTNSWVQRMLAPFFAACAPASRHNLKFSSGSGPQACCKRPRVTDRVFGRGFMVAFWFNPRARVLCALRSESPEEEPDGVGGVVQVKGSA